VGRIIQSVLLALLIGPLFAIPLHFLVGSKETRGDRLFGTWIGFGAQAALVTLYLAFGA
jgi:hypothetical protein